ncbi:ATP-binding protein [Oleiharenicola lentus]|uniref:ATP-binding protein n=1 Tax=Oleiharenicola lentus TaxID=2508720 RepID=UPI00100A47C8|nr:ATP-binding protein [Oleiharenicola lentus]
MPAAERDRLHALDMELTVYYYDPAWKLIWGQGAGGTAYLPMRGETLPIRSGQRVRLEGQIIPAEGLDGSRLKATVLEANAMPEPLPTAGRVGDYAALDAQWVEMEGHVFAQNDADFTHVLFLVLCENHLVNLRLQNNGTDPVPQLVGARIRFRCVYVSTRDPSGNLQDIAGWTSRQDDIKIVSWLADDERFSLPRTTIDRLDQVTKQPWVRIAGELRAQEPGKSITVRDESGQVVIATAQPQMLEQGSAVEVIGRAAPADFGWTLQDPLFRRTGSLARPLLALQGPGQVPLRLRLAEQVLELPPDLAEKRYPVALRGVVTWLDDRADFFYLQDASGGVRVRHPPRRVGGIGPGTQLSLIGVTTRGDYLPEVETLEVVYLGTQAIPPVRGVTLEQALSGAEDGQRVEMRGFIRQVTRENGWTRLDLTTFTGEFSAYLPPDDSLLVLRGALVRVRGVCSAVTNANREITDIRLWVQDRDSVLVDEASPADPFDVASETIAGLRELNVSQLVNHRLKVTGTVLQHVPGRYLYLQEGDSGLFILSRATGRLTVGDRIEAVGFPGRVGNRLVLREGSWRPGPAGPAVVPLVLGNPARPSPEADARLVRIQGVLRQAAPEGQNVNLVLQSGDSIVEATLQNAPTWELPDVGSRVEVTGVYVLEYDEYRRPHGFRLELRAPADVKVLSTPPWWTPGRTLAIIGVLLLVILTVVIWVGVLRRRVHEQTEQIRHQLEKEARLQTELERSSRLESLGVLAGGIAHDFNNLLTAILGNLGLAAMDKRVMEAAGECIGEAERGARRARDITQQLLTFAKGGDPVRTAVALPDIVTEAANFARHGSNVRFEFDFPPNLPPGDVDAGQISRVVHNLVINAVQAMPGGGVVRLALAAATLRADEVDALPAGSYLRLTVTDSGKGIPPEVLPRIFDPYFSTKSKAGNSGLGLATVRSIIRKHNGHIEVESQVGQGTTFRIWLPAAAQKAPVPRGSPVSRSATNQPARVLVMDDEDVIRRVAGRMLSLAGHEATFAADGAEAVRAYRTAQETGRGFDLVIFDLTVPGGMGGKDALQEIIALDPDVRAIASSGYSSDPVMGNPRAFGFRISLPKPYDIPDLLRAVEEVRRD